MYVKKNSYYSSIILLLISSIYQLILSKVTLFNFILIILGFTSSKHHSRLDRWIQNDIYRLLDWLAVIVFIIIYTKKYYKKKFYLISVSICITIFILLKFELISEEKVPQVHSIMHYTIILSIIYLIIKKIICKYIIKNKKMKETIIKFEKGPHKKKYTAYVMDKKTRKVRKIHFGASDYPQYKDRTPLKLYAHKNHNTRKRMQRYFARHSGTKKRGEAIKLEKKKSKGYYNAKILSHVYLW